MSVRICNFWLAAMLLLTILASHSATGAVTVTSFGPYSAIPPTDQWAASDIRTGTTGSSASIVDLTGAGGNLENNQPLPTGAARLTTNSSNLSMAEVGYARNFGTVQSIFDSTDGLELSYSYYKQFVAGSNQFAAPAIKLTFLNSSFAGDGFVTLIYEPYWNSGTGFPVTGDWTDVNIDLDNGLFWGNGGFNIASGAGGPPLRTLNEWRTAFNTASGGAFEAASLVTLKVGIGSDNVNQIDYFDNVHLKTSTFDTTFDFEVAAVPEPASLAIWGIASVLGCGYLRRRRA